MEEGILFKQWKQREFLDLVKLKLNCSSLRSLLQFGIKSHYSTLKDYYSERLLLPRTLFEDLCYLAKINKNQLSFSYLEENWGQIKGGRN